MSFISRIAVTTFVLASLAATAAGQITYSRHFEFDGTALPDATPGVGAFNCSGSPMTTLYTAGCGVLKQRMTLDPNCGAGYYAGTFGAYPVVGAGLATNLPAAIEGSFRLIGGFGGPGTVPDSTLAMGVYAGGQGALAVNVLTGDVALSSTGGFIWTTPPGTAFALHTYRVEVNPVGAGYVAALFIDDALVIGPVATIASVTNGWAFGDGAGSSFIAADIDWNGVSVWQGLAGPGQPNSDEAALFVNRSNTTSEGAPGVKGPFLAITPGGSTMTLEWNGPAYAPYFLMAGPIFPAGANYGCIGWTDIGTPPFYADLTMVFDPFLPFFGSLFYLDGCGYAKQTFTIPPFLPFTPIANIQGGVFTGGACPFVLTAAHYIFS